MRYTQSILWLVAFAGCSYLVYDIYAPRFASPFGFGSGHVSSFVALIGFGIGALFCFVKMFESLPSTPPEALDVDASADDMWGDGRREEEEDEGEEEEDVEDDESEDDHHKGNNSTLVSAGPLRKEIPPDADDPGL